MQFLVCKIGPTFLLGWFHHASPQAMAFVDIKNLILVCNGLLIGPLLLAPYLQKVTDRTQGKFCFVHLENLLRTLKEKPRSD